MSVTLDQITDLVGNGSVVNVPSEDHSLVSGTVTGIVAHNITGQAVVQFKPKGEHGSQTESVIIDLTTATRSVNTVVASTPRDYEGNKGRVVITRPNPARRRN